MKKLVLLTCSLALFACESTSPIANDANVSEPFVENVFKVKVVKDKEGKNKVVEEKSVSKVENAPYKQREVEIEIRSNSEDVKVEDELTMAIITLINSASLTDEQKAQIAEALK